MMAMDNGMDFTTDFPAWTIVSWVLIATLAYLGWTLRRRVDDLERSVRGTPLAENPAWDYQNYHRAASEMMLQAVTYPHNRLGKLAEAEQYALKALELAQMEDQRKFTMKLVDAIGKVRQEWKTQPCEDGGPCPKH